VNVNPFDLDEWEAAYRAIETLNLELQCQDDGKEIEGFLLHIQSDDAWFRY
jgi:ribosome recycling factor